MVNFKKLAFFSSLCFFLSALEYAVPKPVPFFRLGIANLPIMISFLCMSKKESSLLIVLKVLLQAIITGTMFSYIFVFSLAGSAASGFSMMLAYALLYRKGLVSFLGISVVGGLFNNAAQLLCAYFIMFGDSTRFIAPVLLCISFGSSLALGIFANLFVKKSEWLKILSSSDYVEFPLEFNSVEVPASKAKIPSAFVLAISVAAYIMLFITKKAAVVYAVFGFFALLKFILSRKVNLVPSLIIVASMTILNLFNPWGKILFSIGTFNITLGALEQGLVKSGKLCAMVFISQCSVTKEIRLPGKAGIFFADVMKGFGLLSSKKLDLKKKGLIKSIDGRLMELFIFSSAAKTPDSIN